MKIATVTLNPAIDQTVLVDHFQPNSVNRGNDLHLEAGGKGVNVASYLADYGLSAAVTGFLGQENQAIFKQLFAAKQIDDHFVRIPGRTRTGIKIVDEANQQTTDINLPGLTPDAAAMQQLHATIDRLAASCAWFVLAGNPPPGVPISFYAEVVARLRAQGKRVALDTNRDALREGVQAGPTLVKPNIDELQGIVGSPLTDLASIEQAARQLLHNGIEIVAVSMGERGALFVDRHTALVAIPPKVTVKSTVGAGDAMVAGVIAGQIQGLSLADCARLGTAFSVGTITRLGAHLPPHTELQAYLNDVSVHVLDDLLLAQARA